MVSADPHDTDAVRVMAGDMRTDFILVAACLYCAVTPHHPVVADVLSGSGKEAALFMPAVDLSGPNVHRVR